MKRLIIFTLIALTGLSAAASQAVIGSPAPGFTLPESSGASHALSEYAGQVVVLEWTNPDCPFVKKHYSVNNMQALQKSYTGKSVVWLSICSSAPDKQGNYTPEEWAPILARQGSGASALLLDPDGAVGLAYGAKTTPHLFVINTEGILVYDGAIDDTPSTDSADIPESRSYIAEALDSVLAGKPVPVAKTKPYGCSVKY